MEIEVTTTELEIAFFGLLPQFSGMGLGGFLLSEAIRLAWELKPKRVWVHTCTLDHKHALNNYLARDYPSAAKKQSKNRCRIMMIPSGRLRNFIVL